MINELSTSQLIKKSQAKRGAPGTLKRKVSGKMTIAKARALKNKPGATALDKKQANFFINMHSEEVNQKEITVGNYTTTHFHMCGSAIKTMKKHSEKEGAEELTKLQDQFYKFEKQFMDKEPSDSDKQKALSMYNKIMAKARTVGIEKEVDSYMKMHRDSVMKGDPKPGFGRVDESVLSTKTFREYMYDFGTTQATDYAKKMTPGQMENKIDRVRSKLADVGKQMGQTADKINKTIGNEPEPKMKKPANSIFKSHPKYEAKKQGITLGKVRGALYKGAKALGDVQAVRKKKVGKRIVRRLAGRMASRAMRSMF